MRFLRSILASCIMLSMVAPRMVVTCCGETVEGQAAVTSLAEGATCGSCCEAPALSSDSNRPHDSTPHQHPAPHSCTGCGLICCAKVLTSGHSGMASLILVETGTLPGASDTVLSRLTADGIFRPPRTAA